MNDDIPTNDHARMLSKETGFAIGYIRWTRKHGCQANQLLAAARIIQDGLDRGLSYEAFCEEKEFLNRQRTA